MAVYPFPTDFAWGAATAAYQIEGAVREGGRGESIWDRFSHTPGKTHNGDTGDVADDHYHRWPEDVEIMRSLGLRAYRFSVAWPRIIPDGVGPVNEAGLGFYDRLVDGLLGAGIEPFVTLYHWDLPQVLQDRGGWPNRDSVGWFARYADVVSRRLGDRVHHWITHNEPWCTATLGYATGVLAPGLKDQEAARQASHHILLSHGEAVPVLRRNGKAETQVGITLNLSWVQPSSDRAEDVAAARLHDAVVNRLFLDPLFKGEYPHDLPEAEVPSQRPGDLARIATPIDFLGVNYYTRTVISHDPNGGRNRAILPPESEYTEQGWEVYPEGLYKLLLRLHREYRPKAVYITENGAAFPDRLEQGRVHDPRRVNYLRQHFIQAQRAIQRGVPLRGYFVWSLIDNYEWHLGYSKRLGIVYVDYATQVRTLKDSALFYKEVIAANAVRQ